MTVLVTGSAGHLGEALIRVLRSTGENVVGLDVLPGKWTAHVGSITERDVVREAMRGVRSVLHAATLHKPHVATHSRQQFVDTNITGTLNLLEEAVAAGVESFVYTSTTSVFGRAMSPPADAPAVWMTEDVTPIPKNIYGVTKSAAEELCQIVQRRDGMPCIVLRTSRFFPEADDERDKRHAFADDNLKANELLFRRVDIEDVVNAHLLAMRRAPAIGFAKYIISATSPFTRDDLALLHRDAATVVRRHFPDYEREYDRRHWRMLPTIDRVYVNERARRELDWAPKYDFAHVLRCLRSGAAFRSSLAITIGSKRYHGVDFTDGPFPTEGDVG